MKLNFHGMRVDEIRQAIREKKNTDYCGVYELLLHEKLAHTFFGEP